MIQVPNIQLLNPSSIFDVTPQALAQIPTHAVACANWAAFPYTPKVEVKIAQTPSHLLLHFDVQEKCIRAKYTQPNSPVWTDSCVEFFISLDEKKTYYNFEFSCIGTPLMRYNMQPHEGPKASPQTLNNILINSSLGNNAIEKKNGNFTWNMTIAISYSSFFAHEIKSLQGKKIFANVYKCGDELDEPHYLSLFPIRTPEPNFHCPDFFGELIF